MHRIGSIVLMLLVLAGAYGVSAQESAPCPAPYVICLTQDKANETASKLRELIEARNVIAEYVKKDALTSAERDAANALVKRMNEMIALDDRMMSVYERALQQAEKIIEMQTALIEKLTARLNKPKSSWDKFLDALKTVANIAVGIVIGRGL